MTTTPVQPHVQRSPLANCPLAWFASSAHHNLQRVLSPADVARERILTLPPNSPLNTTMVKWFESNAHPVPVLSTCTDLGVILRLVRSGYAWSVLPLCFTLAHEESMVPSPVSIGSPLPALQLCSAFQIEAAQDTLQLVVEMAKSIVRRKPGLAPV
jgi:DNA-binding transcriptional LysR family regulator